MIVARGSLVGGGYGLGNILITHLKEMNTELILFVLLMFVNIKFCMVYWQLWIPISYASSFQYLAGI